MIKPYNTNQRITKENSMFNTLGVDYSSHSLKHQIMFYETEIILQMKPIENEQYFPKSIENHLRLNNQQQTKKRKTLKDVFKFLYDN